MKADGSNEIGGRARLVLPQGVKRAVGFMRSHLQDNPSLSDIVAASGLPERSLNRQFQSFLGVSPMGHLRRLRLAAAREELLQAAEGRSVTEIAAGCGFTHLGRFAIDYQRAFGEPPSTTLRRARSIEATEEVTGPVFARSGYQKPELVVLSLLGETRQEACLADHLSEHIAARLAATSVAAVRLARRQTHDRPLREASAAYCLTGRVAWVDRGLRVTLRLLDVAAGRHLWGDCFDGTPDRLFELEDGIAEGVVCGVLPCIGTAELDRICRKHPALLLARDFALRALPLVRACNNASTRRALALAEQAMALDPDDAFGPALASLCHGQLVNFHGSNDIDRDRAEAHRLFELAGVLERGEPCVVAALANAAGQIPTLNHAMESLSARAVALDPTSGWAWERQAFVRLLLNGDPNTAVSDFCRALRLSGQAISPSYLFAGIARAHLAAGRPSEAVNWMHRAMGENPSGIYLHRYLATCTLAIGDRITAERSIAVLLRVHPHLRASELQSQVPHPNCIAPLVDAGLPL